MDSPTGFVSSSKTRVSFLFLFPRQTHAGWPILSENIDVPRVVVESIGDNFIETAIATAALQFW